MFAERNKLNRFQVFASSVALQVGIGATVLLPCHLQAQESFDQSGVEEIVVTGSHIKRTEFEGSSPLQVIEIGEIERVGATQPMDVIKQLTVNAGSEMMSERGPRAGTSQFNIRGLGYSSTLTLVNGRRAGISPGDDGTGGIYVDINQFPLAMIQRIEVLSDGASATYGSDAVGGVVNIITRKGYEGIELSLETRNAHGIDHRSYSANLATGFKADDGTFNLYATFYNQNRNTRTDFDWLVERIGGDGILQNSRLLSGLGGPGSYSLASGGPSVPDADCEAALGVLRDSNPGTCYFNFADQIGVLSDETRAQVFTEYDYRFSDAVSYFGEAHFSHNIVGRIQGAPGWEGGTFTIPADHPFNFYIEDPANPGSLLYVGPENWDPDTMTAVELTATARPLTAEYNEKQAKAGQLTDRGVFQYLGVTNGLEIDLTNDWFATFSHTWNFGQMDRTAKRTFREDLLIEAIESGEFNLFGTSVTNPDLVSPKDGFSTAANESEVLERVLSTDVINRWTDQHVAEAIFTGPLFGNVDGAFGAQYRYLKEVITWDSLASATEDGTSNLVFPREGTERVTAVFGEAIVPVKDAVELQLALRYEDYSGNIGSTVDPKIAALFQPTDWLNVRGSWGTSFQAPTLRQTSDNIGGQTLNDQVRLVNGTLTCTGIVQNFNTTTINRGSEDLAPQTADNFNLGVTMRPLDNLSVSLDYWNFDYTNLIAQSASPQSIVDNDCNDGVVNDPRIIRDGSGQIRVVVSEFINVGSVQTDGVDAVVVYDRELGPGSLGLDFRATYITSFDIDTGDGQTIDGLNSRNFNNSFETTPDLRANFAVTYSTDRHTLHLAARHIAGYRNDQSNNAPVDSMLTVDGQYSLALDGLLGDGQSVLTLGVNNLFDEDPPALRRADANGRLITQADDPINYIDRPGYDQRAGHDIRGRIIYLRFKHEF